VKRTGALLLLSLLGVVLVLFPGLWRELGRRLRVALLAASGLLLAGGVAGALGGRFETLSAGERAMSIAGIALLGAAWVGAVRSALKR
jgi:hypothetical protein